MAKLNPNRAQLELDDSRALLIHFVVLGENVDMDEI